MCLAKLSDKVLNTLCLKVSGRDSRCSKVDHFTSRNSLSTAFSKSTSTPGFSLRKYHWWACPKQLGSLRVWRRFGVYSYSNQSGYLVTCSMSFGVRPVSSRSSRQRFSSLVSPGSMPPCWNCQRSGKSAREKRSFSLWSLKIPLPAPALKYCFWEGEPVV